MKTRTRNLLSLAIGLAMAGTLTACGGGGSSSGGGTTSTASTGTATLTGNITALGRQQVSMKSGLGISTQLAYLAGQQLFAGSALQAMDCTSITASVGEVSSQVNSSCNFTLTGLPAGNQNLQLSSPTSNASIPVVLGDRHTTRLNNIQMAGNAATSSSHTVINDDTGETHQEAGERNDNNGSSGSNDSSHSNDNSGSNDSNHVNDSNGNEGANDNNGNEGGEGSNDCTATSTGCVHV